MGVNETSSLEITAKIDKICLEKSKMARKVPISLKRTVKVHRRSQFSRLNDIFEVAICCFVALKSREKPRGLQAIQDLPFLQN
jgi:succinate dehydrogenase/fumarate reductase flavoprotein subunit